MTTELKYILLTYWIATTIGGAVYSAKTDFDEFETDEPDEHYTLFDIVGHLFPCMLLAWFFLPLYLLTFIKFKK